MFKNKVKNKVKNIRRFSEVVYNNILVLNIVVFILAKQKHNEYNDRKKSKKAKKANN